MKLKTIFAIVAAILMVAMYSAALAADNNDISGSTFAEADDLFKAAFVQGPFSGGGEGGDVVITSAKGDPICTMYYLYNRPELSIAPDTSFQQIYKFVLAIDNIGLYSTDIPGFLLKRE